MTDAKPLGEMSRSILRSKRTTLKKKVSRLCGMVEQTNQRIYEIDRELRVRANRDR